MIKILKVTGYSLSPFFLPDDYVLILRKEFLLRPLRTGDIIAFTHPDLGLLIKEVIDVNNFRDQIFMGGSHPLSIDSRQFGPVHIRDVIGKVIWHVKNPAEHPIS